MLGACGSQGIEVSKTSPYYRGAVLFRDHCSGCHTLSVVGAQGSATSIKNRVRTNGPNFNIRKENVEQVLYAIRNGGFSGAIMPENIVLGRRRAGRRERSSPSTPGARRRRCPPRTSRSRRNRAPAGGGAACSTSSASGRTPTAFARRSSAACTGLGAIVDEILERDRQVARRDRTSAEGLRAEQKTRSEDVRRARRAAERMRPSCSPRCRR